MVGWMTEVHPAFRNLTPAIPEGSSLGVLWRRGLTCSYLWKNILVKQKMVTGDGGKKGSSLDIAPLTVLVSSALQPRKWQPIGTGCSSAAQASGCP